MKIGFKRGDQWYHTLTRMVTRSGYSHAALEIEGRLYESTARKGGQPTAGVRDYPLTDDVAAQYVWLDLGTAHDAEAKARYEIVRGRGYDYLSWLAYMNIQARDKNRLLCYELVMWLLGGDADQRCTVEVILLLVLNKFRKAPHD